ncbi:hypothetical protein J7L85_04670 [candidate division WOR-3 bacterium]|nr:hypothetical protein [candidate division WOR-3 bacterium]
MDMRDLIKVLGYSPNIIYLLCRLFDKKLTDRGIEEFFAEFDEPITLGLGTKIYPVDIYKESDRSSKRRRVEEVLEFVLENRGEDYFNLIIARVLEKFTINWLKNDEDGRKLLEELNKGKFPWELLSKRDEIVEGFKIPEKVSLIRSELRIRGYETTLHHLKELLSSLSMGNYSAANSQIRTFFESFYVELMHDIVKSACSGGGCRKEFADKYCSQKENELLKVFADLLHTKGAHPGQAEKHEVEFRLILAISWILYSMELVN